MASFRPFRSWSSLSLRAFGPEAVWCLEFSTPNSLSGTSTPPQRLLPLRPAPLPASHADHEPLSKGTRSRTLALQRMRIVLPLFSPCLLARRPAGFAVPTGGPVHRVWLPSRRCKLLDPRKPLSASNALGLCPSELCSRSTMEPRFPSSSSAPALFYETSRPRTGASAVLPRRTSCAPHCGLTI